MGVERQARVEDDHLHHRVDQDLQRLLVTAV